MEYQKQVDFSHSWWIDCCWSKRLIVTFCWKVLINANLRHGLQIFLQISCIPNLIWKFWAKRWSFYYYAGVYGIPCLTINWKVYSALSQAIGYKQSDYQQTQIPKLANQKRLFPQQSKHCNTISWSPSIIISVHNRKVTLTYLPKKLWRRAAHCLLVVNKSIYSNLCVNISGEGNFSLILWLIFYSYVYLSHSTTRMECFL